MMNKYNKFIYVTHIPNRIPNKISEHSSSKCTDRKKKKKHAKLPWLYQITLVMHMTLVMPADLGYTR